jgi:hypothetical protein
VTITSLAVLVAAVAASATQPQPVRAAGPAAQIVDAIARQDLGTLDRLAGGSYLFEEANSSKRKIGGQEVLTMLKGCDGKVVGEPDSGTMYGPRGLIMWVCMDRSPAKSRCLDIGYGAFLWASDKKYPLWISRNDIWSKSRCGVPQILPPRPPQSPPRQGADLR